MNRLEWSIAYPAPSEFDLGEVYERIPSEERDRLENFIQGYLNDHRFSTHDQKLSFIDGIRKGFLASFCKEVE